MNIGIIQQIALAYNQGLEDARNGLSKEEAPMDGASPDAFMAWGQGWEDGQDILRLPVTSRACTALAASVAAQEFDTDLTPNKAREIILQAKEKAFRGGFETCAAYLGASKEEIQKLEALSATKWLDWDDAAREWGKQVQDRINKISPLASPPQIVKAKDFFRF